MWEKYLLYFLPRNRLQFPPTSNGIYIFSSSCHSLSLSQNSKGKGNPIPFVQSRNPKTAISRFSHFPYFRLLGNRKTITILCIISRRHKMRTNGSSAKPRRREMRNSIEFSATANNIVTRRETAQFERFRSLWSVVFFPPGSVCFCVPCGTRTTVAAQRVHFQPRAMQNAQLINVLVWHICNGSCQGVLIQCMSNATGSLTQIE